MNLMHLKYAVEIAKVGSLSRAAENLCMGQPNLSRAIKELEATLGITVFERSTKGMIPTPQGEEFLRYAEKALHEIDVIENLYKSEAIRKKTFSISVPRVSYIAHAFSKFSKSIGAGPTEVFYMETNALRAIRNILESDYHLGIIRYASIHDRYFKQMLEEKGLDYEVITEFTYCLIMSKHHPLAAGDVRYDDLLPYIEIAHADPFVPSLPMAAVKKEELPEGIERRIFVFERGSQFELLSENAETFMWVSPVPDEMLARYGLVQKPCMDNTKKYKDLLIYRKDYKMSELDKTFVNELYDAKQRYLGC